MLNLESFILLSLCVAVSLSSAQIKTPQTYLDTSLPPTRQNQIHRPQSHPTEPVRSKQATAIQPLLRDGTFRVTLNEPPARYVKLEHIMNLVDRVAYAISKPIAVINVIKFIALAMSSLIMSAFSLPGGIVDIASRGRNRERSTWISPFGHLSRPEIEGMIDLMARNYDEMLNRAGLQDRSSCRERSLCVLGDMMACDFPSLVVTVGRFAQQHLPPIDTHKNKYTKALVLGLNQTDCDRAYKTNLYECPSFRDYMRSYFHGGARRRRDHFHWRQ